MNIRTSTSATGNRKIDLFWNYLFIAICIAAAVVSYKMFSPGFMSSDTVDQYTQARTCQYSDWHPVAMTALWSLFMKVHYGPQTMLFMQLGMFWLACYLFAGFLGRFFGLVFLLIAIVSPFVQNFPGYIIKDVQMSFSWLLASVIIIDNLVNKKTAGALQKIVTLGLILYGALIRVDALPGYIPLFVLWCLQFSFFKRRTLLCAMTGILLLFAVQYGIRMLVKPTKGYAERKLYMHDLAGIYKETGEDVFPVELYTVMPGFDTAYIAARYHAATYDHIWWNGDNKATQPPASPEFMPALKSAWIKAITKHPGVYLQNRWDGFLYYLKIKDRNGFLAIYHPWVDKNDYNIELKKDNWHVYYRDWIEGYRHTLWMQPWFWMLMNILLLPFVFLVGSHHRFVYASMLLSSLLYRLPQFFIFQTDTDYRYFYWTCLCCFFSAFLLIKGIIIDRYKKPMHARR